MFERSEQRFQALVETTSDWVWQVDENLVYTYASPKVFEILGYAPEEVLGRTPFDFMSHEEAERVRDSIGRAVEAREPLRVVENRNRHKQGHEVVLETSAVPYFDDLGQFRGYRGIDRDVTARKIAEDALAVSERRFRDLLTTVNLVAVMLDRSGSITFCNGYLLRLTEWGEEDVTGRDWFDLFIPAEVRDGLRAKYLEAVSTGELFAHYENPILTRTGKTRLIEWDNTPLRDTAGAIVGAASLGRDVTDLRLLEAQYRQAQKLESLGRLAGGVAHDFNNLLTVINGYGALLLNQLPEEDPRRQAVGQIVKAGQKAAGLTRALLAFSRKQVIEPRPLNMNDLLPSIEQMASRLLMEGIELVLLPDPDLGLVMADEGQMHQVLMNLVVNANDAMPHGGRLTIKTGNFEIDAGFASRLPEARPGSYALISVSDTGFGMNESIQAKIFEPFFTTKPKGAGTGLGLSTVYGIVRQEQGLVTVRSEPGKGSTFEIFLPRIIALPQKPAEKEAVLTQRTGTETVLVVEDQTQVRMLAVDVLTSAGYQVLEAGNGAEALEVADRHDGTIHLLLTDVVMPVMGGRELAERLSEARPETRVLFMTGYPEEAVEREGVLSIWSACLPKPFAPDVLTTKVRAVLEAER